MNGPSLPENMVFSVSQITDLIKEILEEEDVDKICGYNNRYFA